MPFQWSGESSSGIYKKLQGCNVDEKKGEPFMTIKELDEMTGGPLVDQPYVVDKWPFSGEPPPMPMDPGHVVNPSTGRRPDP